MASGNPTNLKSKVIMQTGASLGGQPFHGEHTYQTVAETRIPVGGVVTAPGLRVDFGECHLETLVDVVLSRIRALQDSGASHPCLGEALESITEGRGWLTRRIQEGMAPRS